MKTPACKLFGSTSMFRKKPGTSDIAKMEANINSGYASQRDPAVGNALLTMLKENRESGRRNTTHSYIIMFLGIISIVIAYLAYKKQ